MGEPTADLQKAILWYAYEHPDIVFKIKALHLRALNAAAKLRGPGFAQLRREEYHPVLAAGSAYRTMQFCRAKFRQRRNSTRCTDDKYNTNVLWKGKRYNVASLTCYRDFLWAICAFLF